MEAFIRGLNPTALRQQVWLVAPTSLEQALTHALRIEAVLEEGERVRIPKVCAVRGKEDSDGEEDTAAVRQTMPVRRCWNCGSPGEGRKIATEMRIPPLSGRPCLTDSIVPAVSPEASSRDRGDASPSPQPSGSPAGGPGGSIPAPADSQPAAPALRRGQRFRRPPLGLSDFVGH
ncbi:UNVERIFIED_CONTAM: hypothetical protein FKN15_008186 [Acipenser sinensis]